MNKEEYLTRLQYCISQLPPVEAQNTMQYYREYFDDAGEENFASCPRHLKKPHLFLLFSQFYVYSVNFIAFWTY